MGKTIVVANQKGGVGKTTTAINLSASLAKMGERVLVVDMDPQGNASSGLGADKNSLEGTIYELLLGTEELSDCLITGLGDNLDLIPANINFSGAEIELIDFPDKEFLLKRVLEQVKKGYDFIVIDCPPSLNLMTINSMCAADAVLVPVQCEYYALEGLTQLIHTIDLVRERLNHDLVIDGVVFTMYDVRTNLSQQVVKNVKENLDLFFYESVIPRNIRLAEAPSYGMSVVEYDPGSKGAEAYMKLAREVKNRSEK